MKHDAGRLHGIPCSRFARVYNLRKILVIPRDEEDWSPYAVYIFVFHSLRLFALLNKLYVEQSYY